MAAAGTPGDLRSDTPDVFAVYALRYAGRTGRRGELFCGYDQQSGDAYEVAYYVWLAVSSTRTVLIDAGLRPDTAAPVPGLRYLASPTDTLADLGIDRTDVGHVVLSHLHYDHTGTARDFTAARYVVQQSELDYWTGPTAARITREGWLVSDDDLAQLSAADAAGRVDLVDGDAEVLPGLSVHLVGGHTAGLQVVRVRTASGHLVLASDASHFYENLEQDRPFPVMHSTPAAYGAFDRLVALADGLDLIVPGHDPAVMSRHAGSDSPDAVVARLA